MNFTLEPLVAALVGTFWLVLGGCGAAILAADFGVVGVSLAVGLAVLTGAYAFGHIQVAVSIRP